MKTALAFLVSLALGISLLAQTPDFPSPQIRALQDASLKQAQEDYPDLNDVNSQLSKVMNRLLQEAINNPASPNHSRAFSPDTPKYFADMAATALGIPVVSGPSVAARAAAKASPTPAQTLPAEILNAVVVISGPAGDGTGFICNFKGKPFIATNQHMLKVGSPLKILTRAGEAITPRQIFAATDRDIAIIQCDSIPAGITPLEIAKMPDNAIVQGDAVIIPGNSKGDGVITQTPGKLLAIGPQKIEVDNPVYHGNSGSPIVHVATGKVIGILANAEFVTFDILEKNSFNSKNSTIKSEVRYFGYRIDSIPQWENLNWDTFQQTEALITQSRSELEDIIAYFTNSSDTWKSFSDLQNSRNTAATIFFDKNHSPADKAEAYSRFLRDVDAFVEHTKARLTNRKIYYIQQGSVANISKIASYISDSVVIIRKDDSLIATLMQRGN